MPGQNQSFGYQSEVPTYQSTANANTNHIMLLNCQLCGSVVVDTEVHEEWHRQFKHPVSFEVGID